ncbi:MAG: hypothetical protein U1F11_02065 [Steroidobacteraceae bacterium]
MKNTSLNSSARRAAERPHDHARSVHVEQEVGQARVLGLGRIRARQQQAPVGVVGARGPDLLAVDHPLVAIADGGSADTGEVGARAGLGEQLAPDHVAADRRTAEHREMLGRAVLHDGGQRHAAAERHDLGARHRVARGFLVEDHLLDQWTGAAADLRGQAEAGEARIRAGRLPQLGDAVDLRLAGARGRQVFRAFGREPAAHRSAECGFVGRVVEIHAPCPAFQAVSASCVARRSCHSRRPPSCSASCWLRR